MVNEPVRRRVSERAGGQCEYCTLRESAWPAGRLQVEHIWPRQHGGPDDESNYALACPPCNQHKGPNLTALDPETGRLVRLFSPRTQNWSDHFRLEDGRVFGQTPTGRATVALLKMNEATRILLRMMPR